MQKQVTVSIYGGLGNQLFQYALGTALAKKNDAELVLDLAWFTCDKPQSVTPWKFSLHSFPRIKFASTNRGGDLFVDTSSPRNVAAKILGRAQRLLRRQTLHVERHFHYDPSVLAAGPGAWMVGYWQSPKYFQHVAETLRDQLGNAPLSFASERINERIVQGNSVCLHVRRGDYLGTTTHPVCDADYYRQATELLSSEINDPHFYIFSDDPEWARSNLRIETGGSTIVDVNDQEQAHQDLILMSRCKHFVIANSTFSWWSAWLSTYAAKKVVCPRRWFATPTLDTRDLIPSGWRRL